MISIFIIFTIITFGFLGIFLFNINSDIYIVKAATTRYVGPGQTYSKIQDAINTSNYGDTVYVYGGIYQENLTLKDGIKLIGQLPNRPILDGTNINIGPHGRVIIIPANDTVIEGFIFKDGDRGIFKGNQGNCKNVSVFRNVFKDQNWTGIHNWNGSAYNISNNVFKNTDYATYTVAGKPGLGLSPSNDTIVNNIYDNCYYAIYGPSGIQRVINNIFINNNLAICKCDHQESFVSNNLFWNNTADYGEPSYGYNDIFMNPKFIDNSYHISWDSPALDKGYSKFTPSIDIDGDIRPFDGNSDGILEYDIGIDEKVNNTLHVNDDAPYGGDGSILHPFKNIQTAINYAFNNFIIKVWEGSYFENVKINKSILLIGNGSTKTKVCGGGNGNIVSITSDNVVLSGFNITNSGNQGATSYVGIDLNHVKNCKIESNNIEDNPNGWWDGRGIYLQNSEYNIITNNTVKNGSDIKLLSSNFNNICKNTFISSSLYIENSESNYMANNFFQNHSYGILLYNSHSNTIINNNCKGNLSIRLFKSNSNIIQNNTCYNNHGILIRYSKNNILQYNNMTLCGILIIGDLLEHWNTHLIDTTNTINDKPVYYWKNLTNGIIPSGVGEVILANCTNVIISEQNLSNGSVGILLGFTSNTIIFNTTCSNNYINGIHFYSSSDNLINNCSILFNSKSDLNLNSDFYFDGESKNNVAINTTFNTTIFEDLKSELIVKNYLHIQIYDSHSKPISDVDIKVKDNDREIYTTSGFQGINQKTNLNGQIKWILVTDRIFKGSTCVVENITTIYLKYENENKINLKRKVNMSTSHLEYFIFNINQLPNKINLKSPLNNSIINNPTPEFKWYSGIDRDSDLLTYYIQIIDEYQDWNSLLVSQQKEIGVLNWNIFTPLIDGDYFWRVCANDGIGNGPWSDVWKLKIDTKAPKSDIQSPIDNKYYNTIESISGISLDTSNGSGVKVVQICITQLNTQKYWDGKNWNGVEKWLSVTGTKIWEYNTTDVQWITDVYYNIRCRAIDNVTNQEIPGQGITFMYDNKPPDILVLIDNNATYTNSQSIILSLNAKDSGSGVSDVAYGSNSTTWSFWEDFNHIKNYELTPIDGEKTIYYQVKDKANNTAISQDTIILDTTPPHSLSILINKGIKEINITEVSLELHSLDNLSGVSEMSFSNDCEIWSKWENFSKNKSYKLSSGDGQKTIYFKVKDLAGNIADPVSANIILNTTIPEKIKPTKEKSSEFEYWWLAIILLILLITLINYFAIKKYKSRSLTQKSQQKAQKPQMQLQIEPQSTQQITQPQQLIQSPQPLSQNFCTTCGLALTYYSQNNRYYCHHCKKYE